MITQYDTLGWGKQLGFQPDMKHLAFASGGIEKMTPRYFREFSNRFRHWLENNKRSHPAE